MTCSSATGILQSGNGSLPIPKSGSRSWIPSSNGSMRTTFRASSPMNAFRSSLRKEVELEESKSADVDRFLSVVERYTDIPELTPCILHEFVEKIIVHAASDPKGKNRMQEIDIYYKGIGVLEMSKVTASMKKRGNGTAEAIPFSLSSRCFLIRSCLAALFVLLYAFALLRQIQIQISTACANTPNIHAAAVFIDRIQNHVISRNILRYPDTAA